MTGSADKQIGFVDPLSRFRIAGLVLFGALLLLLAGCGLTAQMSTDSPPASSSASSTTADMPATDRPTTEGSATDRNSERTPEFAAFLEIREQQATAGITFTERSESAEGFLYTLQEGQLSIADEEGNELWHSSDNWWIDDFALTDVNGDGMCDVLFSLWKSWSYYGDPPLGEEADDPAVRNHLFLYTIAQGQVKALWCSSNLPRPIVSFELRLDGQQTPVSSGMRLYTTEGVYRDDFAAPPPEDMSSQVYHWEGWGFVSAD